MFHSKTICQCKDIGLSNIFSVIYDSSFLRSFFRHTSVLLKVTSGHSELLLAKNLYYSTIYVCIYVQCALGWRACIMCVYKREKQKNIYKITPKYSYGIL